MRVSKISPLIFARIKLHEGRHKEGDAAKYGGDDEEIEIAREFLQRTAHQTGQHHAQSHEAGGEGVVRRGVLAARKLQEVDHVGGEAETVAELLQEHEGTNQREVFGLVIGEDDIERVGYRDARHHRPEPTLHATLAGGEDATENAAERQTHDAYRALHEAYLGRGKCQAAFLHAVEQEEGRYLGEKRLGQAVKQHERQGTDDAGLLEKADKGLYNVEGKIVCGARAFCQDFSAGQRRKMPGGKQ